MISHFGEKYHKILNLALCAALKLVERRSFVHCHNNPTTRIQWTSRRWSSQRVSLMLQIFTWYKTDSITLLLWIKFKVNT